MSLMASIHAPRVLSLDWDWFVGEYDGQRCCCCRDCKAGRTVGPSKRKFDVRFKQRPVRKFNQESEEAGNVPPYLLSLRDASEPDAWHYREKCTVELVKALEKCTIQRLVVANSHGHILKAMPSGAEVFNLDLHPDDWTDLETCGSECAEWAQDARIRKYHWIFADAQFQALKRSIRKWKTLDVLFLALSSPHTAQSEDALFYQFVRDLANKAEPEFLGAWRSRMKARYERLWTKR